MAPEWLLEDSASYPGREMAVGKIVDLKFI